MPEREPHHHSSRVVAIVGGAGGIGQGIAQAYLAKGDRVAIIDYDPERLEKAKHALGRSERCEGFRCDIRDEEECRTTISKILSDWGRIDILVHSAGLTQVSPCRFTSMDVYRRVFDVNVFGVIAMTKAALSELIDRKGQIIVMSSICGFAPLIGRTGYCASKYALHGFFDTLACEVASDGVSVLIVCPSFVDTDFATRGLSGDGTRLSFDRSTLGKPLDPVEAGKAIMRAADRKRSLLVLGWRGYLSHWLMRLTPAWYKRMMSKRFEVELSREATDSP